tara:strand:- start:11124 stop:12023 length:900 start_codon:yes stop_codon:yes gene_type:complete
MVKALYSDYAPADSIFFVGKVISNTDPLRLGRVQIRVMGIHTDNLSDIPTADLPWAQVLTTDGGSSGVGQFIPYQPGAFVVGVFLDGRSAQIPMIIGSTPTIQEPTPTQRTDPKAPAYPDAIQRKASLTEANSPVDGTAIDQNITSDVSGSTNSEKIFNFFTANGYTPEQTCGFIGNFSIESNLNPSALNPNDKGKPAFGLAQWRGDRLEGLEYYSREIGRDKSDLEAQLQWTIHELRNKEKSAGAKIRNARTVTEATFVICRFYERPSFKIVGGTYTSPSLRKRVADAKESFERFARS